MFLVNPRAHKSTRTLGAITAVLLMVTAATGAAEAAEPDPSASSAPSASPTPGASHGTDASPTAEATPAPDPSPSASPAPSGDEPEKPATAQRSLAAAAIEGPDSTVNAPRTVRSGASATVTFSADSGQDGTGRVWYRTGPSWVQSSITFPINDGEGTATWVPETSRSYRIETSFGVTSPVFAISKEDPQRRATVVAFTADDYAAGEMIWLRGYTYKLTKGFKTKVVIERRYKSSSSWTTVATVNSASNGYFSYRLVATSAYVFRARQVNTWAYTGPVSVDGLSSSADRTLEQRAADLAWITGSSTSSIQSVSASDLPSGVHSARFRNYTRGAIVEVTTSSSVRSWYLYDRIYDHYVKSGRWGGSMGLPLRDMKCGLIESGCVQRFTEGALYMNASSMSKGVYVGYGSGIESEIVATARSQKGYEEPSWRHNKYNSWVKGNAAWCSVFVSWSGTASGNAAAIPVKKTYASYVSSLKASGRLHYSGKPPLGASVLFDWGTGNPTHSGLVRGYAGTTRIATIEGNTTDGSGDPQRGVYERTRLLSDVWAWYMP